MNAEESVTIAAPESTGSLYPAELSSDFPAIVWETAITPDRRTIRFTFLSDSAARILGYSREQLLLPSTWETMVHPDDAEGFRMQVQAFFRDGDRATVQHRVITGDGRTIPIEATMTLVRNTEGVPVALRGVTLDISERYENMRRWQLLVEAGKYFSESSDAIEALDKSIRRLVPTMADLCHVYLVQPPEGRDRVMVSAATAELEHLARYSSERFPPRPDTRSMIFDVLEARRSFLLSEVTDEFRREHSISPEHLEHMQQLNIRSAVFTPLFVEEQMFGVVAMSRVGERIRFRDEDQLFLEEFSRLASFAIHKARLASEAMAEAERRRVAEERINFLAEISAMFASTLDRDTALKELGKALTPKYVDVCAVIVSNAGEPPQPIAIESQSQRVLESMRQLHQRFPVPPDARYGLQRVLETGEPEIHLRFDDELLRSFSQNEEHFQLFRSMGLTSSATVPMIAHDRTFGALVLCCTEESGRVFEQEDITLFEEIGRRSAFALYKLVLLRSAESEIQRRARLQERLELMEEVGRCVSASLDLHELLQRIAGTIAPRIADWLTIDLQDPNGEFSRVFIYHSDPTLQPVAESYRTRFPNPHRALAEIVKTGEPVCVASSEEDDPSRFGLEPERWKALQDLGVSSVIMVPLRSRRRTLGVLGVDYGFSGRQYSRDDIELVQEIADRIAAGIDNAMLFEEAQVELKRRIELQQSLESAKETVEIASRAKDHFIATLSHELRTPLTPVMATVELLAEDKDFPESLQPFVELIRRNIEIETRLIDDLLDVTRISKGKLRLREVDVDLHALLPDVIDICRNDMDQKGLRLATRFKADHPYVHGDRDRLSQVFWNLLHNATKFTPEGGLVTISTRNDGDRSIVIEVQDTGRGIEPKEIRQIFEPFEQRAEPQGGLRGGLGLGLAISKSILELHGGTIEARSDGVGKGSIFLVRLTTTQVRPRATVKLAIPRRNGRGGKILMVDDHHDTNSALKVLLERRGYEVLTASCVRDGIELARQHTFDLLVSDIGLPDGDGIDLLRAIRAAADSAGVRPMPAIALSGYGTDADVERSRNAGFEYHLKKPIAFPELERAILDVLSATHSQNSTASHS